MNLLLEKEMVRVSQSQNETVELERVFAKDMVSALIGACFDRDDKVKQSAHASLNDYGQKAPNLVLNSLYSYLMPLIVTNHAKVDQERKVKLLESVLNIVETNIHDLSASCRSQVILLASEELIKSQKKSVLASSQGVSSKILVSLAQHTVDDIMQEMVKNLRPGDLPSESVVETIAALFTKNVLGMAPYIGPIFKVIVPLCGLVKADTTRVAFAKLFGNCCEAILEYTAVSNGDSAITRETFSVELSEIYQAINKSAWITSRDLEVSRSTARTLGKICRLFEKKKLDEIAGRLITLLLALFKRHNLDLILITKSLGDVLISLTAFKSDVLTDHKEAVAASLHNEICNNSGGELTAETAKSFNELLRCFGILSERNATFLIHFLLNKATFRDEKIRSGNLIVLRHLINSSDDFLTSGDKELILKGFHKHLGETSIKVRHDMTKFITAMATHNYLQLEGGREYVKFVVCECSTKIPSIEDSVHNNATVAVQLEEWEKQRKKQREMCSELLHLMATTVENTDELFWPYLFEFLLKPNFENAFGPVVRVLHQISSMKLEKGEIEDSEDGSPKLENVSETDLIARFVVVLSDLKRFPDCACDTFLKLLRNLAICFDRKLVGLWNERITEMLEFCRNSNGQDKRMMRVTWEEKLLAFLSETLERMENEKWFCRMSTSISSQFSLYPTNSQSKNFSLRCYGVVLSRIQDKERIKHDLNLAVEQFIHSSARERQGLAMLMGYVGSKHLDQVLSELQNTVAVYITTKESSFSNFFSVFKSEKTLSELENAKSTVALSLGHVTYHMPRDLLGVKLESEIIRMLLPLLRGLKSANSKSHAAEAIDLIGQALNNDHVSLDTDKILVGPVDSAIMNRSAGDGNVEIAPSLTARDELLSRLVKYFKDDSTGDDSLVTKVPAFLTKNIRIIRACTTLSELEPTLSQSDTKKMLKPCLNYVMTCHAARKGEISYESEDGEDRLLGAEEILVTNARELNHLLVAILKKQNTLQNLEFIFQQFEDYLKSEYSYQRYRAIQCCETLFSYFLNHPFKPDSKTSIVSLLLAKIIPACGDNLDDIRLKSLMCVQRLLEIQIKSSGVTKDRPLEGFGILTEVADKLTSNESEVVYDGIRDLSKLVCVRLPLDVLQYNPGSFTCALMDALLWKQQSSANTACLVLIHIFETRSALFERKIEQIVSCIFSKMDLLPYDKSSTNFTRNGILRLFVILIRHFAHQVLDAILDKSLPFSNAASECLLHTGMDDNLMLESVDYLIDSLDAISPYEEASLSTKFFKSSSVKRVASKRALTISTALEWLLKSYASKIECERDGKRNEEELKMLNVPLGYKVVSSLIVRLGSMCEAKSPHNLNKINPFRQALELLRVSFLVFFDSKVNKNLDNLQTWSCLDVEVTATSSGYDFNYFYEKLHLILITMCKNEPDKSEKMVTCVNKYVSSKFELQRATVAAFFAMVVQETLEGQLDLLLEIIINSLLTRLADNSPIVRKLCLRGLANIVYAPSHQIDRYSAVVIDALVSGMEDADDPQLSIALQAMNGLCEFLDKAPNTNIDAQLINICLRVRPCFEKEDVAIRSMAFRLFGMLANFITSNTSIKFKDQIDTCFIQIVLHLFDSSEQVVKACKSALCRLGGLMENETLSEYFYDKLHHDEDLDCNTFMNELSTIVIGGYTARSNVFIQQCIGFFTAQWPQLRSAAAIFAGHMLHNLNEEMRDSINKDQIGAAFTQLMKDSDSSVRADAARSICLLYCY